MTQPRYQKTRRPTPTTTPTQTPQTTQIITRPLTPTDLTSLQQVYHGHQKTLRILGAVSLIFVIATTFFWDATYDAEPETFVLYLTMFLFGLGAIILSLKTLTLRKNITTATHTGTGVEVHAQAHRTGTARNAAIWTIGPISMRATPETTPMLTEGAQVKAVCIPLINMVLSINDHDLRYGARMKYQPQHTPPRTVQTQTTTPQPSKQEEIKAIEHAVDKAIRSDERLAMLKDLRDKGLITQQDYEQKKEQILVEI